MIISAAQFETLVRRRRVIPDPLLIIGPGELRYADLELLALDQPWSFEGGQLERLFADGATLAIPEGNGIDVLDLIEELRAAKTIEDVRTEHVAWGIFDKHLDQERMKQELINIYLGGGYTLGWERLFSVLYTLPIKARDILEDVTHEIFLDTPPPYLAWTYSRDAFRAATGEIHRMRRKLFLKRCSRRRRKV